MPLLQFYIQVAIYFWECRIIASVYLKTGTSFIRAYFDILGELTSLRATLGKESLYVG